VLVCETGTSALTSLLGLVALNLRQPLNHGIKVVKELLEHGSCNRMVAELVGFLDCHVAQCWFRCEELVAAEEDSEETANSLNLLRNRTRRFELGELFLDGDDLGAKRLCEQTRLLGLTFTAGAQFRLFPIIIIIIAVAL